MKSIYNLRTLMKQADLNHAQMHSYLMQFSELMPMKTIKIDDRDYLERYWMSTEADGTQHWLHRFLTSDSERHLHSHPWSAESHVLCGWYREQFETMEVLRKQGDVNYITPETLHRIVDVKPNTWTHMIVMPARYDTWHFIDDDGFKKIMQTSDREWYLNCKPRTNQ